jgi:hypothetical protein
MSRARLVLVGHMIIHQSSDDSCDVVEGVSTSPMMDKATESMMTEATSAKGSWDLEVLYCLTGEFCHIAQGL